MKLPEIGKISREVFDELIYSRLGAERKEVLVGPQHGVDVGIVEIGDKAVALTTDPVFIVPEYGFERAAWFAVHILASDVVTSGLKPTYMAIDLNLPFEITEDQLKIIWEVIDRECKKLGITIICGHTARYENCHYPMVGGATVISVGDKDKYVSPRLISKGDKIIITKGPAIEASGIFAAMFPDLLRDRFGADFAQKAKGLFYKMSVVEDALTSCSIGVRENGVTAMHDATECGVWGGLYEIAQASRWGLIIEEGKIVVEPCVNEICKYFKIDSYKSISEGTLILTCRPHKAEEIIRALSKKNILASVVGEVVDSTQGIILIKEGKERKLEHPRVDPFWNAFYQALKEHKAK
ncbi:MAG: AIR synthase family protein [Candidatus Aerophobetes bacterium]|nr:AIR synthase family protein [Candidatus Aerophobetes bacterium]